MKLVEIIKKARRQKGKWVDLNNEGRSIRYIGCGRFEECFEGYDAEVPNNGHWIKTYETTQSELLETI